LRQTSFWVLAGLVGSSVLAGANQPSATQAPPRATAEPVPTPNPIQVENAKPGTRGWYITKPAMNGEIQAYAGEDSINKGEDVHLYVSSQRPYTMQLYRLGYYGGAGARLMANFAVSPAIPQGYWVFNMDAPKPQNGLPVNCPTCIISQKDEKGQETNIRDVNWKLTNTVHFPASWTSGIYLFKLTESAGNQWMVPLVLRDDGAKADLVFQDPANTDQAYNRWGGTSLYKNYLLADDGSGGHAFYESWNRPFDQKYGSGHVLVWTYTMLRFLEEQGYNVTYSTNNAVALGLTNLLNYKGFVSAGHDEYWSQAERKKLEDAIASGVSAAFFGGNDIYRQVRNYPDLQGRAARWMAGYDNPPLDSIQTKGPLGVSLATGQWRLPAINDPEDKILVSMYNAINYRNQNLIVKNTGHWVFTGTGLQEGDAIPGILGYEVDSLLNPARLTVPGERVTIIGQSPFQNADRIPKTLVSVAALREITRTNNIVFNAGTIYWPYGLNNFHLEYHEESQVPVSAALRQMTNNILQRMITGKVPAITAASVISQTWADASTQSIHLRLTTALNATTASDAVHYTITINGQAVRAESAGYNANNQTITLSLPVDTLHIGDVVAVRWDGLSDNAGVVLKPGEVRLGVR